MCKMVNELCLSLSLTHSATLFPFLLSMHNILFLASPILTSDLSPVLLLRLHCPLLQLLYYLQRIIHERQIVTSTIGYYVYSLF